MTHFLKNSLIWFSDSGTIWYLEWLGCNQKKMIFHLVLNVPWEEWDHQADMILIDLDSIIVLIHHVKTITCNILYFHLLDSSSFHLQPVSPIFSTPVTLLISASYLPLLPHTQKRVRMWCEWIHSTWIIELYITELSYCHYKDFATITRIVLCQKSITNWSWTWGNINYSKHHQNK